MECSAFPNNQTIGDTMKEDNSTIVEIKDKEVDITTNVKSNLDNLKEAIRHQIEQVGCYIYDSEPHLSTTDYDEEVTITLERSEWDIDSIVDDDFMKGVVRKLEHLNKKETSNG